MNENAYRVRTERGQVQIGTWVTMIRTPAILTLLQAAGLDFARVDMEHSPFSGPRTWPRTSACWGRRGSARSWTSTVTDWWRRPASTAKRWRC